ncbi:membrane protein [Streptomyces sp. F-3]|jgi:hypothetical protein|uniref:Uncharacterized protein n=1 Tax=Streptomyces thermogriseus TaxID=75292 RepID=A0ABP4DDQ8_9ACTN|nr:MULTISPECIES: hypothetical protein [Streptomyces]MDN5385245.1 hypothetical protein [Streptomyces sp. LB8]GAT80301.1 membrane protein [Streptomyces sp. F-3]
MGGPGDPPEGTPEGAPGGAEDEYRSVVFDESFVRAARLQEYSAQERISAHTPAVRRRPPLRRGPSRQALILALLIALAFGTAIYLGIRHPQQTPQVQQPVTALRATVVPLAPQGKVPGAGDPEVLYAHSPAARFAIGAEGIPLPVVRRTAHFSHSQIVAALSAAKDYVVASSLDPQVLTEGRTHPVRALLAPGQLDQFDRSIDAPAADGRHAPTGWLVRFDPDRVELADRRIRVQGSLRAVEADATTLEVSADHTLVYALKPAGSAAGEPASLFTVRRELQFRLTHDDVRLHRVQLAVAHVRAGPLSCAEDTANHFRPLLAGQTAKAGGPAGTDPYAPDSTTALCGALAPGAQPRM